MIGSPLITYTFLGPAFAHGGGQPSINVGVVHDVEASMKVGQVRSLIGPNYFGHGGDPGKPVSIHYMVGPDDIGQGTSEDIIAWHVGNSNPGTIGIEQLGFASWDTATWMEQAQAQFVNLGKLMADISRRNPLIRLRWLTDAEALFALDHKSSPGGWVTHKQLSRIGRSTGHTDPGDGYPSDYVMGLAQGQPPEELTMSDITAILAAISDLRNHVDAVQNQVNSIQGQVSFLYNDNHIDGQPYGKQAAGFNDVRGMWDDLKWLKVNETFLDADGNVSEPYSKTAANFNDVRGLIDTVNALSVKVDSLLPKA